MSDTKKTENEAILKQLAGDIQAGHRRIIDNVRGTLSQAKLNGQWLTEARELVPHGYWKAWVRDNCKFSDRMAIKYMNVARHYDALVALFNTEKEWTLTEFFALAAKEEAKSKRGRDGKPGKRQAANDPFRLEKRQRNKKVKDLENLKSKGTPPVAKCEPVQNFLSRQCERLLGAVRRFALSKEVKEVAGEFDTAMLGILLLDSLKQRLALEDLFSAPDDADATDATRPVQPNNRLGQHLSGNGKEKKSVA